MKSLSSRRIEINIFTIIMAYNTLSSRGYAELSVTITIDLSALCDGARTQRCSKNKRISAQEAPCHRNAMIYQDVPEPSPSELSDFCGVHKDWCAAQWLRWVPFFARVHEDPSKFGARHRFSN